MKRVNYSSKSPWEVLRGYSRAVVVGDNLYVSGTTAVASDGTVVGAGDAYLQTSFVLNRVKQILQQANFSLSDVVRTRLFVTQISDWDKYARAHQEVFGEIRPASSIVQVAKLVDPRFMIEMEVDAIRGQLGVASQELSLQEG